MRSKENSMYVAHWVKQPGYVYFIGAGKPLVAIKIGIATAGTLKKRLKAIQSSNHEEIWIMGLIPFMDGETPMADANKKEIELHERFKDCRRFQEGSVGGEWFSAQESIVSYVENHCKSAEALNEKHEITKLGPGLINA